MLKLIYLHQYFRFPSQSGGTRSYDLANQFSLNGYDVTIISATSEEVYNNGTLWNYVEKEGLKLYYIYLPYSNKLSYFQRSIVFFKFLWYSTFLMLKLKCDVIIATSTPLTIGIPALIKKWVHKTPFIFETRDIWPEAVIAIGALKNKLLQKSMYYLESLLYKNAVAIVPLSIDMKKSIVSRFPQYASKADKVIENISEVTRFQQSNEILNLEELIGFQPRFSILYAGTFGRVNGIHKIIELAEMTLRLDDKLVFILYGAGAEKQKVLDLAKENGLLNKNVFMFDSINKNELPKIYNAVSMGSSFVIDIPSLWANSANKFFDTLASAKPILINHEGWQADAIRNNDIGYVLPFNLNIEDAKKFVAYTLQKEKIDLQSKNALNLAVEKYSLEVATAKYLEVLGSIKYIVK